MIGSAVRRLLLAFALLGATAGVAVAAAPTVTTGPLSRLSPIGATLTGTVNANGEPTTFLFQYGPTASYGSTAPTTGPGSSGSGTTDQTERASISGLQPNTTYHYRLTATNPSGTTNGQDQTFTTPQNPLPLPSATTGPANNPTASTVTLTGTVNPNGQATAYHFEYGPDTNYASRTGGKPAGSGTTDTPASQAVSGLQSGTTYHYRIVAESLAGSFNGADMTFTTAGGTPPPPPAAPVPTTGAATAIGGTVATLTGTVDPMGIDTGYTFEYGTTTAYGATTPLGAAPAAAGIATVTADLTGLTPSTTYHYRLDASSSAGIVFGPDMTFTTGPPGTIPPPPTTGGGPGTGTTPTPVGPPVVVTGPVSQAVQTAATLTGTVNPNGQAVLYVFQYGTTTAYAQHAAGKRTAATVGPIQVSSDIFKLQPNTTYHYRLTAITDAGVGVLGEDQTFTTPPVGGTTGTGGDQRCSIGPWGLPPHRTLPPGFVLVKTGAKSALGRGGYLAVNQACFPNVHGTTRPAKCTFGPWKNPVRVPTGFRLIKTGPGNPRGRGGYLLLSTACFPGPSTPSTPSTPSKTPTPTPGPPNQGFF